MRKILILMLLPIAGYSSEVFIGAQWNYAQLQGLAQTPKGGDYNTTSTLRPTFKEMGINHDNIVAFNMGAHFANNEIRYDYYSLDAQGQNNLKHTLLTHAKRIPAHTLFAMQVHYNWHAIRLAQSFALTPQLKLTPFIAGNWFRYSYNFSSLVASSERAFNILAPTLGLDAQWTQKKWQWHLQGQSHIGVNNLSLYKWQLGLGYPWKLEKILIEPRVQIGYLSIRYEDDQNIANHIKYLANPYMGLQLSISPIISF